MTLLQYASYLFSIRNDDCLLLKFGKLSEQLIVDVFSMIEAIQLNYLRYHQEQLHADLYMGVVDQMKRLADEVGAELVRKIILYLRL